MTEQQTAATDHALLEKLVKVEGNTPDSLGICTMWHRNPDGPEAAERIKSLQAENADLHASLTYMVAAKLEAEADRQRMRDALEAIASERVGDQAWSYARAALNPASKEANDG